MNTLKFAIIGCEHVHIATFIKEMLALGHECLGIYEPRNVKLAESLSNQYRVPMVKDKDKLFREAHVIGSSAINQEKIDMIEECEQFGKPIMIDKPAVTNRKDLLRFQAVMHRGLVEVGMLLTERFHPAVFTLKRHIEQGKLGKLVSIGMRKPHLLNETSRPPWFFSKEQSGGIVIDLLIHDFDLLRWLTGKEVVQSEGFMAQRIITTYPDFYDTASLQVLMEDRLVAQLQTDWFTPNQSWTWGDGRIFVTGSTGFAELRLSGDPFVEREGALMLCTTNTEQPMFVELEQPQLTITQDFLHRVEGKRSQISKQDIYLATAATIQADESVRIMKSTTE